MKRLRDKTAYLHFYFFLVVAFMVLGIKFEVKNYKPNWIKHLMLRYESARSILTATPPTQNGSGDGIQQISSTLKIKKPERRAKRFCRSLRINNIFIAG